MNGIGCTGDNSSSLICLCLDELGKTVGKGTFGKVVECKDLKRYVEKNGCFQ